MLNPKKLCNTCMAKFHSCLTVEPIQLLISLYSRAPWFSNKARSYQSQSAANVQWEVLHFKNIGEKFVNKHQHLCFKTFSLSFTYYNKKCVWPENTHLLTSCLSGLDSAALLMFNHQQIYQSNRTSAGRGYFTL